MMELRYIVVKDRRTACWQVLDTLTCRPIGGSTYHHIYITLAAAERQVQRMEDSRETVAR